MSYLTADEYRAEAQKARAASTGIDKDGFYKDDSFVSDWAGRVMAGRYDAAASFIDDGERMPITALFNIDGTVASTHQADGQYGTYWVLNDEAAERFGKRFFTPSQAHKNIAADRKRGFTFGTILVPAYLDSSMLTQPRVDALRAGEYEIIRTDDNAGRVSHCMDECCSAVAA